jgi:hypothetical protein
VTSLRSRRLIALLSLAFTLTATACSGGDAIPNEPAEDAGPGSAPGENGGIGGDGVEQPPPGVDQGLSDTGDDLEEPTE